MLPIDFSVAVLTAFTALLLASKAATIFRLGDIAIRLKEPVATGAVRGRVSFLPSMATSAPNVTDVWTPCAAKTRSVVPLDDPEFDPL